jgi:ketosteroid isomerase-like protein
MLRRSLFAAFAAVFALGCAHSAQADEMPADLAAAVAAFDQAQIAGDRAELERLVADDYVLIGSDGVVQNKAQFIADFTSPNFRIQPFTVEEPVVRHYGDTAVTAGRVALSGTSSGTPFTVNLRFSDVWVKRDGVWRVAFAQTTRIP